MADTVRTLSALQTLLASGSPGSISAQDLRDFLVSALKRSGQTVSGTTTLDTDAVFVKCATGTYTITLPTAASAANQFITFVKLVSGGTITIDGNGSETINGATQQTMTTQYTKMTLWSDGTEWFIVG